MPLVPNVLALLSHRGTGNRDGPRRIIINFGPAAGPTVSGIVVDYFSWRMLFIILIPICILVLIATHLIIRKNVVSSQAVVP